MRFSARKISFHVCLTLHQMTIFEVPTNTIDADMFSNSTKEKRENQEYVQTSSLMLC